MGVGRQRVHLGGVTCLLHPLEEYTHTAYCTGGWGGGGGGGSALGLLLLVLGVEPLAYLVTTEAAILVDRQSLRVDGGPGKGEGYGGAG